MKVPHVLGSMALTTALAFSGPTAYAANVTDLGNLNDGPVVNQTLLQVGAAWLPDLYEFDLSTDSSVTVDFTALLGLGLGATFSLYDSADALIKSFDIPLLSLGSTTSFTFNDIDAGTDYAFKFNPGLLMANVSSTLTFTATPVPEPESSALMLLGLGMIGLIARRKFV